MDTKTRVSIRIKALRTRRGMSQQDLAEKTNRSVDTISAIERGKSFPNYETLQRLADALGVSVQDFFEPDAPTASNVRTRLLTEISDALRSLSDDELKLASEMIRALERSKPRG